MHGGAGDFAPLVFRAGTGWVLFQAVSLLFGVPVLANAILIAGVLIDPRRTFLLFFVLPVPGWLLVVVSLLFELASVARWDLGTGQAAGNIAGLLAGGLAYQMLTGAWEWKWPRRNNLYKTYPADGSHAGVVCGLTFTQYNLRYTTRTSV